MMFTRRFYIYRIQTVQSNVGQVNKPTLQFGAPATGFQWEIEVATAAIIPNGLGTSADVNGPEGISSDPPNQARLIAFGTGLDDPLLAAVNSIPSRAMFPINTPILAPNGTTNLQMHITGHNNTGAMIPSVDFVGTLQIAEYQTN